MADFAGADVRGGDGRVFVAVVANGLEAHQQFARNAQTDDLFPAISRMTGDFDEAAADRIQARAGLALCEQDVAGTEIDLLYRIGHEAIELGGREYAVIAMQLIETGIGSWGRACCLPGSRRQMRT